METKESVLDRIINPSKEQEEYLSKWIETKRLIWNILVDRFDTKNEVGKYIKYSRADVAKYLDELKSKGKLPKDVIEEFITSSMYEYNYDKERFMSRIGRKPVRKEKGDITSFMCGNPTNNKIEGDNLYIMLDSDIPEIRQALRMNKPVNTSGKVKSIFIHRKSSFWLVSIRMTPMNRIIIVPTDEYMFTLSSGARVGKVEELKDLVKKRSEFKSSDL